MEYSSLSKELTRNLSSTIKKENGIYFTPPLCVNSNINLLKPYMSEIKTILEPSCGSGEFITTLKSSFSQEVSITGIEYNETIYNSILQLNADNVSIIKQDYLTFAPSTKYDLIIGNPPFYVMKKESVDKIYYPYFDGRPNIFILFIIKSLEHLNDNGILSFILPKNFLNCLYYDKTRNYISKNFQLLHIVECTNKFIDTQQETITLIIRKPRVKTGIDNKKYVLNIHSYTIFVIEDNMNMNNIVKLYENSKTLWDLGFTVSVGNVVWNQCKDILTHDVTKTRLIYCSDIVDNKLSIKAYKNGNKKNYIDKPGTNRPMIVINRGYGVGEYKFNYCLINETMSYLVENHLICIEYNQDKIDKIELIKMYEKVIKSLKDERTQEFIKLYFGNNAINTTELNYILPIYYDI